MEAHCRRKEKERMRDDGMKNYEGLMGILREKFGSHECIKCNGPLNGVKKRDKLV